MANIERTVKILFSAEDSLSMKITGINQGFELLSKTVNAILGPLAQFGDMIVKLDQTAFRFATTLGKEVTDSAMTLENKMIDLNRLLGEEGAQFDELIEGARALSREFGVSLEDVVQSVIDFKRANFDAQESLDLTREALTLVRVGFVDMGTASESLVKILKGFRADASSANEIVDILSQTSNTYATNVEKLAIGMAELAPIASKVGFSMAETAGLATAVIEVFQSGEEAATALKTGFTRLATESSQVTKGLEKLGLSQTDANGQIKTGKQLLEEIAGAMGKFTETEQVQISALLVGNRQAQKMVDIFTNYNKVLEIGEKSISDRQYAEKQLAEVMKATSVQLDRLETGWTELTAAMGKDFLPAVSDVLNGMHSIETALTDAINSGALKEIGEILKEYAEEVRKYLERIAVAIPEALSGVDYGPLLRSWENIAESLREVFDKAHIDTAEGLRSAIQTLVDAMTGLLNVTNGMLQPWIDFAQKMLAAMEVLGGTDEEIQTRFGNILGHAQMIDKLGLIWYSVFQAMGGDVNTFQYNVASFFDKIERSIEWNKQVWYSWSMLINGTFASIASLFNILTFKQIPALQTASDGLWNRQYELHTLMRDSTEKYLSHAEDSIDSYRQSVKALQEQQEDLKKSFDFSLESGEKFSGTLSEMAAKINELPPKTVIDIHPKERLEDIIADLKKLGVEVIELPDEKVIIVTGMLDRPALEAAIEEWNARLPKETHTMIFLHVDEVSLNRTIQAIDQNLPESKHVDLIISKVDEAIEDITRVNVQLEGVKPTKEVKWALKETEKFMEQLHQLRVKFEEGPDERNLKIYLQNFKETLENILNFQDELDKIPTEKLTVINTEADESGIDDVKKALAELPAEQQVKITLEFDEKMYKAQTERIKALGDQAQKSWEIEAKLETEYAENAAEILCERIRAEADKTIAAIEALADAIASVAGAAEGMFGSLTDMYTKMADIALEEMEIIDDVVEKFQEAEEEIADCIEEMDKFLDKLEQLTEELSDQEGTVDDLNDELAQYERALKRIERGVSVDQLNKDLRSVQTEIGSIENELERLYSSPYSKENEARIRELEDRLEYLKREEEILQKTIEDRQAAKEEFEEKIEELHRRIWELQKKIKEKQDEINDTIDDTTEAIEDTRAEWQKWMDDIDEAKRRIQELYDQGLISKEEYEKAMDFWNSLEQRVRDFMQTVKEETGVEDISKLEEMSAQKKLAVLHEIKSILMEQSKLLEGYLADQMAMQERLVDAQIRLIDAQIDQIEARTELLKSGDSMIKIDGDGLAPELEAFMWKILENIQVRANAEFSEFLLGLRGLNLESTTGSL